MSIIPQFSEILKRLVKRGALHQIPDMKLPGDMLWIAGHVQCPEECCRLLLQWWNPTLSDCMMMVRKEEDSQDLLPEIERYVWIDCSVETRKENLLNQV